MNLFTENEYRSLLKSVLLDKKARFGCVFTFEKMAGACKLQRTYLSAVLAGKGHLNSDQVYLACGFLELKDDEYRYVSLLHERERSIVKSRRAVLGREIDELRQQALQTDAYVTSKPIVAPNNEVLMDFYLDLNAQLTHMFLTIKHFRRDPERIRNALNLDTMVFREVMAKIERAGLIKTTGKTIEVMRDDFHLPAAHSLYPNYRMQMRLKALEHMQTRPKDDHYSFSVVYSANETSRNQIRARFMELIDWAQTLTQNEDPAHVYQINFDLLRWG